MDVVSVKLSMEESGFVIGEEDIAAIVIRAGSDTAEALEGGAGMRRLADVSLVMVGMEQLRREEKRSIELVLMPAPLLRATCRMMLQMLPGSE